MAIYRGPGGAGDATNDATSQAILAAQSAQEAAASEAASATNASNASTSATNAASSATAAANSATSAANSASTATTQAANAASSAATATTKASEASTSATNAASSASAAATSATNAASSATAAANSATSASNSASAASTSASNAATYASNAATSATNAAASETNAASSANSASNSATSAAASATSAGNSASSATTSATNAANSASAAATSASNAATSATSASNSATSAGTSATNAANSASSASTSATNAASSASGAASSASSAAASAAAAAASLDSFDDRYLGSKTADPTLDNDGNALVTGALYYNSVEGEMRVYDGFQWIAASAASQAILVVYKYTATAGQTTFTGTDDNALTLAYTVGSIIVTVNGVVQEVGTDVTASTGTSIILAVAASAGDEVNIHAFSTFDVANTYTRAEADAKYLTIASPTIPSGTANGVAYLNGSKVLTTGSALTFNGTGLGVGVASAGFALDVGGSDGTNIALRSTGTSSARFRSYVNGSESGVIGFLNGGGQFFEVAGSEQMRLTSTGLGIGTSSPSSYSAKLAVVSTAADTRLTIIDDTANGRGGYLRSNYSDAFILGTTSGVRDIVFAPDSTERMRINTSGNVGIGTSSPAQLLTLNGPSPIIQLTDSDTGGYCYINASSTAGSLTLHADQGNTLANSSMNFVVDGTERMRIDSSGNVQLSTAGTKVLNSSGRPILNQSGSILQVVSTASSSAFSTSSGAAQATGLSVTITPASTSSKVLVLVTGNGRATAGGSSNCYIECWLYRSGTQIWHGFAQAGNFGSTDLRGRIGIEFLDSPATTSAVTYQLYIGSTYAAAVYLNNSGGTSTITAMEVSA